jgi:hypothetical protein
MHIEGRTKETSVDLADIRNQRLTVIYISTFDCLPLYRTRVCVSTYSPNNLPLFYSSNPSHYFLLLFLFI